MHISDVDIQTVSYAYNSYVYDPFGNRIDPTTGKKLRTPEFKQNQGYTRDGNIIQPFAFTGYREEQPMLIAKGKSASHCEEKFTLTGTTV